MGKKVKTVRDTKGRFYKPTLTAYQWNTIATVLVLPTLALLVISWFTVFPPATAEAKTLKDFYPKTTEGVCLKYKDYKDRGGKLVADHMKEATEICKKAGVDITK